VVTELELKNGDSGNSRGSDINTLGERVQVLLERIDQMPPGGAKELIQECMEAVMAFYGQGLNSILQIVRNAGSEGSKVYRDLIHDDVIQGLLLIHDLHPLTLEVRLREALDKVRPYLKSHGGNVELIQLEEGVAKLRLLGTCQSCASSSVTLELAIRNAIERACPDLVHFDVEGLLQEQKPSREIPASRRTTADWTVIENVQELPENGWVPVRAGETRLIICKVNKTVYAYRNRCPACNMPFDGGALNDGLLSCALGHRYDVRHAGRCQEIPSAHLDPLPLLADNGVVKVALTREVRDVIPEPTPAGN
jgi:Fe-S cluster biogenesis protein NfuA/nitrite reductase/ring-hydroxylating ferredoxin subunit